MIVLEKNITSLTNKIITGKMIEIVIMLTVLGVSIPIWDSFEEKIAKANISTLEDYKMSFTIDKKETGDQVIAENPYNINKNFKIYLEVDKENNDDNSKIKVNNEEYQLKEFEHQEIDNHLLYILVDNYLTAGVESYDICLNMNKDNNSYRYLFEENNIF